MTAIPSTAPLRRWAPWAVAAVWWTLDGFASATNYHRMAQASGAAITWEAVLRTTMASVWLWIPFTVLALWMAERFPLDAGAWRRHLPAHLLAAAGVCLARALLVVALNGWIGWYTELPPFRDVLFTSVANNLFLFWMLVGVGHALVYARRYQERDRQLVRAELDALKMQLHPHFLFNTLNTVVSLIRTDGDKAERMIARLSDLLRHTLESAGVHEVSLREELQVARAYLEIERTRFEDRLRVVWRIDPSARAARVPHLVLQPLIENAIRHGIAPRAGGGTVTVAAERDAGELRLRVRDDGVGPAGRARPGSGVGLANTRARLRQLYGAEGRLRAGGTPEQGWEVEIRLPFRPERAVTHEAIPHAAAV